MKTNEFRSGRIVIGTAQFGMLYGVANSAGKPSLETVSSILDLAREAGVEMLDTAPSYGDAEQLLGDVGVSGWRISTKIPSLKKLSPREAADFSVRSARESMRKMRIDHLHALMLHDPIDATGDRGEEVVGSLANLRDSGVVSRIGVSLYSADQLIGMPSWFKPDIVQAPANVFDQRLLADGIIDRLDSEGVELHLRSLFLQGLLLMGPSERPPYFNSWKEALERFQATVASNKSDPLSFCLAMGLSFPGNPNLVLGIETTEQLIEILAAVERAPSRVDFQGLACDDLDLIDPRRWGVIR